MKQFNVDEFMARDAGNFRPEQVLGMLVATMHQHYEEEHKKKLREFLGVYDNPIELKQKIMKELEGEKNAGTNTAGDSEATNRNQLRLI